MTSALQIVTGNSWSKERQLLYKRVKELDIRISSMAKEIGCSRSLLSQYINKDDYPLSDELMEKIREYLIKINYWEDADIYKESSGYISNISELKPVITQAWKRVWYVLDATWENKNFGMVTGASGAGKTAAVKYWLEQNNNSLKSIMITANGCMTRKSILRRIAKELGIFVSADADALIERICNELRAEPKLIIIDEADQLCNELKLETLRSIIDNCDGDVGIVLIGNEDLSNHILRMAIDKRKLSRLHNRFGANQKVSMPTDDEARAWLERVNLSSKAKLMLIARLQRINGAGGYRVVLNILKTVFASIGDKEITEDILQSQGLAHAVLSLNA